MVLALFLALLLPFRIDAGPYAGAYRLAPDGAVNWYFATTALLHVRTLPEPQTREYLDAYLEHVDPNGGIADVLPMPTGIFAPVAPDSEDAYAGTLLSLAVRYRNASHDGAWWRRNVAKLQDIAYAKLLTQVKPNGLIRASRTDPTGYLMDNSEDYEGLRAFAEALTSDRDPQARYVTAFIAPLGIAIHSLYRTALHAYLWSDNDPLGPLVAYPACTAQLFPQLYGVRGTSRTSDDAQFAGARMTAARCHLSPHDDPHESLLYALYITRLTNPSASERAFLATVRKETFLHADLVTIALRDALASENPIATSLR
jgi:hypothetical protein